VNAKHLLEGLTILRMLLESARTFELQPAEMHFLRAARALAEHLDRLDAPQGPAADPVTTTPSPGGSGEGAAGARGAEPRPHERVTQGTLDTACFPGSVVDEDARWNIALELREWRGWSRRNP
jgi:hypothetical protein